MPTATLTETHLAFPDSTSRWGMARHLEGRRTRPATSIAETQILPGLRTEARNSDRIVILHTYVCDTVLVNGRWSLDQRVELQDMDGVPSPSPLALGSGFRARGGAWDLGLGGCKL